MNLQKSTLAIVVIGLMHGCGTMSNRTGPDKVNSSAMTGDSGIVLMSAGAPEKCVSTATALVIQPAGSEYGKDAVASVAVDAYVLKSDFADHQGFLHALVLKAGTYQIYPTILNPYVKPVRVSKAEFTIKANEVTYIGEYYMPVACVWNPVVEFRDEEQRDTSLLKTKNESLATLPRTKRLAKFTGCLYGCDK